ncbi:MULTISPECIES: signal peptidase I [unclassified Paenibacillus]|uniref:Signal peptidase I n=1 Tax=Paenibacillus provencensis TaxID=441151 RepID=A0ABW3Q922_9BACL|nr:MULTISPECIES: signal peptidase I [unclassified Paenibacillus]MCM3129474.1 signal peptidase I [Paenibacillus sp. MER 78]SFS73677.1 signal peptidase I [Paenibacillus sp. 453mf]
MSREIPPDIENTATTSSSGSTLSGELLDWLKTILIAIVLMLLLNLFVFNISIVKGESMQPTLAELDRLFINKIVYEFDKPKRYDVVVLHDPSHTPDRKEFLVKRVIGIPGETVEIREHVLYINEEPQTEPYTNTLIEDPDFGPVKLEEGRYFVMGDNRHAGKSKDSRSFGSVSAEEIVGKAEFIFWPMSDMKKL